jgi:hypothetical protein
MYLIILFPKVHLLQCWQATLPKFGGALRGGSHGLCSFSGLPCGWPPWGLQNCKEHLFSVHLEGNGPGDPLACPFLSDMWPEQTGPEGSVWIFGFLLSAKTDAGDFH